MRTDWTTDKRYREFMAIPDRQHEPEKCACCGETKENLSPFIDGNTCHTCLVYEMEVLQQMGEEYQNEQELKEAIEFYNENYK